MCLSPFLIASRQKGWCPTPATTATARSPPRFGLRRRQCSSERLPRSTLVCFAQLSSAAFSNIPLWVHLAPHLNAFLFDAPRSNRFGAWNRGGVAPVPHRSGTRSTPHVESSPEAVCLVSCSSHHGPSPTFPFSAFPRRQSGQCQKTRWRRRRPDLPTAAAATMLLAQPPT